MEMRNPFRLLKNEQVGIGSTFHFLFGYHMVQIFEEKVDVLWNRLQIIRSAPGGGKTSLLKIFTVESLMAIQKNSTNDTYKELFEMVNRLGVFKPEGLAVLGVYLRFTTSFSQIEDLKVDDTIKDRLFFSLLNVRVLFGVLKAVCVLNDLEYPKDLPLIHLSPQSYDNPSMKELFPDGNGQALLEKGRAIERKIIKIIDSINGGIIDDFFGMSSLLMWQVLAQGAVVCKGERLESRFLFMLDDVHDLAPRQRGILLKALESVYPTACWVAERYEALNMHGALITASTKGREYSLYEVEKWASDQKGSFQRGLGYIADRRVAASNAIEAVSFSPLLAEKLDKDGERRCRDAVEALSLRVQKLAESQRRFEPWIEEIKRSSPESSYEKAIRFRALEIVIRRKMKRDQTLFPDYALSTEELNKMDSLDAQKAAKLFVAQEFNISYYYGLATLKQLSSGNIEQFLSINGNIFEEMLATKTLRRKEPHLSTGRQESIIMNAAKDRFEQVSQRMASGIAIKRLIGNFGYFAQARTYELTAPYAPGVTGFAIRESDRQRLSNKAFLEKNPQYRELANALREATANNLFESRSNQLCKGKEWFVLYLNRLLCVHFKLPLDYGGWKEQSIETLNLWLKRTPAPPAKQESLKGMVDL